MPTLFLKLEFLCHAGTITFIRNLNKKRVVRNAVAHIRLKLCHFGDFQSGAREDSRKTETG
jgi:hypothetical protein